jgi:hypothetical protein
LPTTLLVRTQGPATNAQSPETGPFCGTGPHPPRGPSCASSCLGASLTALCTTHHSCDPCTVLHKRKLPATPRPPHNPNKLLLLRQNWVRSAKTPRRRRHPMHTANPQPETKFRKIAKSATRQRLALAASGRNHKTTKSVTPHPRNSPPEPAGGIACIPRAFAAQRFPRFVHSNAQTQPAHLSGILPLSDPY